MKTFTAQKKEQAFTQSDNMRQINLACTIRMEMQKNHILITITDLTMTKRYLIWLQNIVDQISIIISVKHAEIYSNTSALQSMLR